MGGCGSDKKDNNAEPSPSSTIPQVVTPGPTSLRADQLPASVQSAAAEAGRKGDVSGITQSKEAGALVEQDSQFVSFADSSWFLDEAIKPTGAALAETRKTEPSLDWTATYDQPDQEQTMILTTHLRGLTVEGGVLAKVVKKSGAKVIDGTVNGKKAQWVDVPGGNVIVLIALSDTYTLQVETEGVDLKTTLDLVKEVKPTTQAKWTADGGHIADCQPGDDCAAVKS
jgi:hypothetical protein